MTRRAALASLLFLAAGCAGGARSEDPAAAGVPGEAAAAPAAGERSGDAIAAEALERGGALEKQGRGNDAAAVYKEALGRDDVSPKLRADLSLRLSHRLAENGHWEPALAYARDAKKLRPDWDDAAFTVAKLEKKMAAKDGADAMAVADAGAKKHKMKGEGSVEDRLARVEDQLARMAEKWEAFSKSGGAHGAKEPGAKERGGAGDADVQALKEKLHRVHADFDEQRVALKKHIAAGEEERAALKKRVQALEEECAALRAENEKLRAGR